MQLNKQTKMFSDTTHLKNKTLEIKILVNEPTGRIF